MLSLRLWLSRRRLLLPKRRVTPTWGLCCLLGYGCLEGGSFSIEKGNTYLRTVLSLRLWMSRRRLLLQRWRVTPTWGLCCLLGYRCLEGGSFSIEKGNTYLRTVLSLRLWLSRRRLLLQRWRVTPTWGLCCLLGYGCLKGGFTFACRPTWGLCCLLGYGNILSKSHLSFLITNISMKCFHTDTMFCYFFSN